MRGHDRCPSVLGVAAQGIGQPGLGHGVRASRGFIQHPNRRLVGEHRSDRDPLLLAHGKVSRVPRAKRGQVPAFERPIDRFLRVTVAQRLGQFFAHRFVVERDRRVLGHETRECRPLDNAGWGFAAAKSDPALGLANEPGDGPEKRRLAAPVWPDQGDDLALAERKRGIAKCCQFTVSHREPFDTEQLGARRPGVLVRSQVEDSPGKRRLRLGDGQRHGCELQPAADFADRWY